MNAGAKSMLLSRLEIVHMCVPSLLYLISLWTSPVYIRGELVILQGILFIRKLVSNYMHIYFLLHSNRKDNLKFFLS